MTSISDILLFLLLWSQTECARILIYNPSIGHYHTKFMGTIEQALINDNHEVVELFSIVNPNVIRSDFNGSVKVITVEPNEESVEILKRGETHEDGLASFWREDSLFQKFKKAVCTPMNFSLILSEQCRKSSDPTIIDQLRTQQYDLAITESFDLCGLGIFHLLNVSRVITVSSIPLHEWFNEQLGLPKNNDLVPTKFGNQVLESHRKGSTYMRFTDVIRNFLASHFVCANMFEKLAEEERAIFVNLTSEEFPSFKTLLRNSHILLENIHPLLEFSVPTLPLIVPIGGVTVSKPRQLSEKYQSILNDSSKKNVLVSFGTVIGVHTMPDTCKRNLMHAFASTPEARFIFKCESSAFEGHQKPSNVIFESWLPQNDLLASGKIDLFISHMGMGSFMEASYSGVPLIAMPIFVDQPYNAAIAIRAGTAIFVDKISLQTNGTELVDAIRTHFTTNEFKLSADQLKKNIELFGNQTDFMMQKINFVLGIPPHSISKAFDNSLESMDCFNQMRVTFTRHCGLWMFLAEVVIVGIVLYLLSFLPRRALIYLFLIIPTLPKFYSLLKTSVCFICIHYI